MFIIFIFLDNHIYIISLKSFIETKANDKLEIQNGTGDEGINLPINQNLRQKLTDFEDQD